METIKLKTKVEILQETADFYSEETNRRSQDASGSCIYIAKNGNKCAFSRCCKEDGKTIKFLEEYNEDSNVIDLEGTAGLDNLLKSEYHGHCVEFWQQVQSFHDDSYNFTAPKGLSVVGEALLSSMQNRWKDNTN